MTNHKSLINAIYKCLLLSEADPIGLETYSKLFEEKKFGEAIINLLNSIIKSEEFFVVYKGSMLCLKSSYLLK